MAQSVFSAWSTNDKIVDAGSKGQFPAREHTCHRCGRAFKRSEHLNRHLRTHTKEKPFRCHCGAPFARQDLLKRHIRLSHPERYVSARHTNEEPPLAQANEDEAMDSEATQPAIQHYHGQDSATVNPSLLAPGSTVLQPQPINDHTMPIPSPHTSLMMESSLQDLDFDSLLNTSPGEQAHLQQLANFMDSMGLLTDFVTFDLVQHESSEEAVVQTTPNQNDAGDDDGADTPHIDPRSRPLSPFRSWLPSPPPTDHNMRDAPDPMASARRRAPQTPFFEVTREQRAWLETQLAKFKDVLPGFYLPSHHSLTRYLASFIDGFHSHFPYVHVPTASVEDFTPDALLAFAATGAQYVFEHRNADRLFYAGKAILLERMRRQRADRFQSPATSPKSVVAQGLDCGRARRFKRVSTVQDWDGRASQDSVERARALHQCLEAAVTLMGYGAWEGVNLLRESLQLASVVVECLRDMGISTTSPSEAAIDQTWKGWAQAESERRTRLVAFTFLETLSIAYNTPPYLMSSQFNIRLPCTTAEWKASTEGEWKSARTSIVSEQMHYQPALAVLFDTSKSDSPPSPMTTPFGNYILLHGLLQRISLASEISNPTDDQINTMSRSEFDHIEYALRSWTVVWQKTPESSLDPRNANGPIPFTSSALLGLAYVRLHLRLGPHRSLETRDKSRIASSLFLSPPVRRGHRILPAILYAVHALSLPVRLGIESVGRSQAFFWSIRHGLSSLECAVLLAKWLIAVHNARPETEISKKEHRMIRWVRYIVKEALESCDSEDSAEEDDQSIDKTELVNGLPIRELALHVLCIWSRMFRCNVQWPFLNIIGLSLQEYAHMLEAEFVSSGSQSNGAVQSPRTNRTGVSALESAAHT